MEVRNNAPFTLQAVCPIVRSFTWRRNCLPGGPISFSVVHTTGGVICSYAHSAKCPNPSTTVPDSCGTLCHSGETSNTLHYWHIYHCYLYGPHGNTEKDFPSQSTDELHIRVGCNQKTAACRLQSKSVEQIQLPI